MSSAAASVGAQYVSYSDTLTVNTASDSGRESSAALRRTRRRPLYDRPFARGNGKKFQPLQPFFQVGAVLDDEDRPIPFGKNIPAFPHGTAEGFGAIQKFQKFCLQLPFHMYTYTLPPCKSQSLSAKLQPCAAARKQILSLTPAAGSGRPRCRKCPPADTRRAHRPQARSRRGAPASWRRRKPYRTAERWRHLP